MKVCINCNTNIVANAKYCSNRCQAAYRHSEYIESWKLGFKDGERGILTKNISAHLVRYLKAKYNNSCSLCNWRMTNESTGQVPLEIDHIDGDSSNNVESNLRLICPNCHSLTPNYKNSNLGKGREWRRAKYIKSES